VLRPGAPRWAGGVGGSEGPSGSSGGDRQGGDAVTDRLRRIGWDRAVGGRSGPDPQRGRVSDRSPAGCRSGPGRGRPGYGVAAPRGRRGRRPGRTKARPLVPVGRAAENLRLLLREVCVVGGVQGLTRRRHSPERASGHVG